MSSRASIRDQVAAITRRDARLELSYHFQLTMRYVSTVFVVAVFFFIGKLVGDAEPLEQFQGGYFAFALIGLVVMGLAAIGLREVSRTFTGEASAGTLEILLASPTPLSLILAGSLVIPFGLGLIDTSIYLLIGRTLGGVVYTLPGPLLAAPILVLTIGTFVAVGILATAFLVLTRRGEPFTILALQATNLLAGTLYPVEVLPEPLQIAAHLVPAFYGLRALREVLLSGAGLESIWDEALILLAFNVVLLPLSMWALRRALRLARTTGTLASS
ncbi:MAG: ABC transporter permease [Acidimicrobiia bacterium]